MTGPGELVLVATPIGNLGDMSERAIATLASADVVCCEDTRRTGKLLELTATKAKRLLSLHAHNESARTGEILQLLAEGRRVAVVTDAGMPVVSDPGTGLVRAAHDAGYK
ncbi:MAG: SAM-dependent methyltransferase, partial [Acidimicrobiales bacterium]